MRFSCPSGVNSTTPVCECAIRSSSQRCDVPRLIGLYRAGRLKLDELITRRYSLDEAPQALADLERAGAGRGVVLF
jgi:S-(hydroxymethyl)glutathione dehydrogenase/alcohol dehydrogenase